MTKECWWCKSDDMGWEPAEVLIIGTAFEYLNCTIAEMIEERRTIYGSDMDLIIISDTEFISAYIPNGHVSYWKFCMQPLEAAWGP